MTERETIRRLVGLLKARTPFIHVRFGDGDVFFATGTGPQLTADGEEWSAGLQFRLRDAWRTLARAPNLLLGDVASYAVSDGCEPQWLELLAELTGLRGVEPELVHIEALRAGLGYARDFYTTVADDDRPKVYVCPDNLLPAARMLDAVWVPVPLRVSHTVAVDVAAEVALSGAEVALFSAGRGGKLMQAALSVLVPEMTQIDVGSGLDLLFDGVRRGTDRGVDIGALARSYRDAGLHVG